MPLPKPSQRRRRVLAHSDEDVGPDIHTVDPQSSSPLWDKTGPSLHRGAAQWTGDNKSESGTVSWDRTGPSLHHSSKRSREQRKSDTPSWDKTGPSLHHQSPRAKPASKMEPFAEHRTGPSLHQPTSLAKAKSETPFWDKTGPSLYKPSAKGKGKAVDDGIGWGNNRVAVVIETPKSWFERQAEARKRAGVSVATESSVMRKPVRRRIVEVVIPVPRYAPLYMPELTIAGDAQPRKEGSWNRYQILTRMSPSAR